MGLTGYYRKFIKGYAQIAHPLTEQLKKDNFGWSSAATTAFTTLQHAMTSTPILAMPDFSKVFEVETDASGFGLGAVLSQGGHPIAFFSKMLGTRARLKSIYEKELMAIVLAVLKWRHYLLGRRFLVKTDQQSLRYLMEQREVGPEYQKWVSKLLGYDFEISYRSGASNRVADALSREYSGLVELQSTIAACGVDWSQLQQEMDGDPFIQQLMVAIQGGSNPPLGYTVVQNQLMYKGRLVIPTSSYLIPILLKEYHDSPLGGHSGEFKTYQRIAQEWFWVGMRKQIATYVQACATCQQQKHVNLSPAGLLQPLPIPSQVWEAISMDFIEGLPKSKSYDSILVVVDRFTKYSHFVGLKHPFTAYSVALVFMK